MNFMHENHPVQAVAALCILSAAVFLAGCAAKSADTPAAGAPSAADAKMGNDYGKGVAAHHAQQQTPSPAVPANP